jgi:hypothetical protein
MIQRKSRPLGLTLLTQSIHSKATIDDKVIGQLINYSLNHNLCYHNKPFTIDTLSDLLGISKATAYKHYLQHTSRVANLINPSNVGGLYLGQIFDLLAGASGTLRDIRSQKQILQVAQGQEYVPFLTEQVNNILGTEMAAYEKMAKIAGALLTNINPNALPQNPNGTPDEKAIGINEAMKLMEAQGRLQISYGQEANQSLADKYLSNPNVPVVIANQQQGNTEDQALVKMSKNNHRTRRVKELDIDEDPD